MNPSRYKKYAVFKPLCCLILLLVAVSVSFGQSKTPFYLQDGDRVVFYGDSITAQRFYSQWVETYVSTRFPGMKVRFVHSGWNGDRTTGSGGGTIETRIDRDVLAYHPTVVTSMLGMNDGRYLPLNDERSKAYRTGYENIISQIQRGDPSTRITLIQPSPYDDVTRPPLFAGGYNAVMLQFGKDVEAMAKAHNLALTDFNTPVVNLLTKVNTSDPEDAKKLLPDRVHPAQAAHLVMAEALLKTWNAPSIVTAVEIDAQKVKIARADNTKVSELVANGSLKWEQLDRALPMPVGLQEPLVKLVLGASDFTSALNQETLRITGLADGSYVLSIDGKKVGAFTALELRTGINLALFSTPMMKQAERVRELIATHNDLHYTRWHTVQFALADVHLENYQSTMDKLDTIENELVEHIRTEATPTTHTYLIRPVAATASK